MATQAFKKHQRLLHACSYQNVFDNVEFKCGGKYLLILCCRNQLPHGRLGLAVSKKHLKKAVTRNRLKRLIRASFQQNQLRLEGLDIVVLLRNNRSVAASNQQIFQDLEQLWLRLSNKIEKNVL